MPPLVLALIDAVFALAFHHDARARRAPRSEHESVRVHAELSGPELGEPAVGGLRVRVAIRSTNYTHEPATIHEDAVLVHVDVALERLLALELGLAELPLNRSGFARLLGELETWCYARIPG